MRAQIWLRVTAVASVISAIAAAQQLGYRYDANGNIVGVLSVANDRNNCGAVDQACSTTQNCFDGVCCGVQPCNGVCCATSAVCFANQCCTPVACNQFSMCGSRDNQCGGTATCAPGCSGGQSCTGNLCYTVGTASSSEENNATGEISIVAGTKWPVQVTAQFMSARGAYANAMTLSPDPVSAPPACPVNGGTPKCLLDTFTCNQCPSDPNAQSGELSCWCILPPPIVYKDIPAGQSLSFTSDLLIDKDLDQRSDETRSSSSRIGPAGQGDSLGQVRYHRVLDNIWRYEWEDNEKPPAGDFNDYIGQLAFKDCDGTFFQSSLASWSERGLECRDGCNSGPCPKPEDSKPADFRLGAKLMVDETNGEHYREKRGRLLTLSVALQSRRSQDVAVCPRINFALKRGAPDVGLWEYTAKGATACTAATVVPDQTLGFVATCVGTKPSAQVLPIHLAREQWYAAQCMQSGPNTIVGPGDIITLGPGTSCAAETQVLDYQLSLEAVDSALGGQFLNGLSASELLFDPATFASSIDLFVFDNLPPGIAFHCPTGVNAEFQSWADSSTVRVRQYTLVNENRPTAGLPVFGVEIRP